VKAAEEMLAGTKPDATLFRKAGEAAVVGATPLKYNAFKVELAARAVERALRELTGLT
jgi:xanthine dehydrogenase YagS FAD-binding subunit